MFVKCVTPYSIPRMPRLSFPIFPSGKHCFLGCKFHSSGFFSRFDYFSFQKSCIIERHPHVDLFCLERGDLQDSRRRRDASSFEGFLPTNKEFPRTRGSVKSPSAEARLPTRSISKTEETRQRTRGRKRAYRKGRKDTRAKKCLSFPPCAPLSRCALR